MLVIAPVLYDDLKRNVSIR